MYIIHTILNVKDCITTKFYNKLLQGSIQIQSSTTHYNEYLTITFNLLINFSTKKTTFLLKDVDPMFKNGFSQFSFQF